ncbi:hypothetical protein R1sor_020094 [Riccia sorocarpa]|uniref:DDE Tnp4 domain-containing protein n=1 Tax=Riccia sorocarpa TaxID=122646 RepID=A0ABD3IIU4_9MARC
MVNYTNRVMIALESCMGHEIAWPDRQGRAVIAEHFATLGFPGCVRLVDGTLVKLSQRPRDDGETYFDRKSNYSLKVQVICDQNKRARQVVATAKHSCTMLQLKFFRRSIANIAVNNRRRNEHCIGILKARWHSLKEIRTQLRNARENAYVIHWIRCCIILHNFLIWRNDEWSDEDHPIELERDADIRLPPQVVVLIMAMDAPQAGAPLHFELYTEEDEDNYMRWKWISKKEAHHVLRGIDAALLQRSGLHDGLGYMTRIKSVKRSGPAGSR